MRRSLARVLRIRSLFEELSQLELETRTAEVRQLESTAERQRQMALEARADAHRVLADAGTIRAASWLTGIADAELLAWRSGRLRAAAQEKRPAVEAARELFLARRTERRQVECLVTSVVEAEKKEQVRSDQTRVDDWFQSRAARRKKDE